MTIADEIRHAVLPVDWVLDTEVAKSGSLCRCDGAIFQGRIADMKMEQVWLDCQITPGQFTGEYAVYGISFNGEGFSLFASANGIRCREFRAGDASVRAQLRVCVVDQRAELRLIELPRQTLENGQLVTFKVTQLTFDDVPSRQKGCLRRAIDNFVERRAAQGAGSAAVDHQAGTAASIPVDRHGTLSLRHSFD